MQKCEHLPSFLLRVVRRALLSIVCVKREEGVTTISADSALCTEESRKSVPGFKLFEVDGWIFGFVGMAEVPTLFKLFIRDYKIESEDFTAVDMTELIINFADFMKEIRPEFDANHGAMLMAKRDKVFVSEGLSVIEVKDTYAIGSGSEVANVMLSLGASTYDAVDKACETNIWCYWPIETYTLGETTEHTISGRK